MSHSLKKKKEIGAYYTPSGVTRILSDWAIRSQDDNTLEPSFGSCGFLEASRDRLISLGSANIANQIFGCDIDRFAFDQLTSKFGLVNVTNRFILADFLEVNPQCFSVQKFDAVLGNPPYISHHNMAVTQKYNAHAIVRETGVKLSAKASLWAYFLIHGISFVKDGGRMAWVLPGSFLNTGYGKDVHDVLIKNFEIVSAVVLNERIFLSEGAEERSIIVLCENKGTKSAHDITVHYADSIVALEECITSSTLRSTRNNFSGRVAYNLMSCEAKQVLDSLFMHSDMCDFGGLADIRIGIVTGDNGFFIVNKEDARKRCLTAAMLKPIVIKYRMISGLSFTQDDIDYEISTGVKCLLVDTTKMRNNSSSLIEYLKTYPAEKFNANRTFAKRRIWHRADDGKTPDAFMSYMQHNGPRIALNTAGTTSTNTVHRVYFKNISKQKQKMAAISFVSTLTQISAEIEGRSYGSGVLKQEPSEARKVKICIPNKLSVNEVNSLYKSIDDLLRKGKTEEARVAVDNAIYPHLGISDKTASLLNETLSGLRKIRQR
jgi:adenine-specific DNA-methyltransferase